MNHWTIVREHAQKTPQGNLAFFEIQIIPAIYRLHMGHIWAVHKPYTAHSTGHRWTIPNIQKMGSGGEAAAPHFLHIYYGPSVACTVGCTWLMYSLCMAHIWPMYDPYMAYIWPYVHIWQVLYIYQCMVFERAQVKLDGGGGKNANTRRGHH